MATLRQPVRRQTPGAFWPLLLAGVVAVLVGGAWALHRSSEANAVDPDTGCLLRGAAPVAVLFMIDSTDRLSEANIAMIADAIADRARAIPRASRTIAILFGDDTSSAFTPVDISPCTRPSGEDARLDENAKFLDEDYKAYRKDLIAKLHAAIAAAPSSHTSPITEQVQRAANSPSLHWEGSKRELMLFSDGLETGATSRSGRRFSLRPAEAAVLDGIAATFVEIGNARDHRQQTHREREAWRQWLSAAGATSPRMVAPGYADAPR